MTYRSFPLCVSTFSIGPRYAIWRHLDPADLVSRGSAYDHRAPAKKRPDYARSFATPAMCWKEPDLLETRCAVLSQSGYDAQSASLQEAETLLLGEKFDLIIVFCLVDRIGKEPHCCSSWTHAHSRFA
jgi:hypothetical protein